MAIWIKELTGSPAWAGLVIFCFALGNLFAAVGGGVVAVIDAATFGVAILTLLWRTNA